ncbi:hypothetical protein ACNR90_001117 [Candidozyma auris]
MPRNDRDGKSAKRKSHSRKKKKAVKPFINASEEHKLSGSLLDLQFYCYWG